MRLIGALWTPLFLDHIEVERIGEPRAIIVIGFILSHFEFASAWGEIFYEPIYCERRGSKSVKILIFKARYGWTSWIREVDFTEKKVMKVCDVRAYCKDIRGSKWNPVDDHTQKWFFKIINTLFDCVHFLFCQRLYCWEGTFHWLLLCS